MIPLAFALTAMVLLGFAVPVESRLGGSGKDVSSRISLGLERVPEMEEACPKLIASGLAPKVAHACGTILLLQSHVHLRPNYVAHHGTANTCALFYHPTCWRRTFCG